MPSLDPARRSLAARAAAASRWGWPEAGALRQQLTVERLADEIRAAVRNRLSDAEWFELLAALRDPAPVEVSRP
jgi:hypothetical protein